MTDTTMTERAKGPIEILCREIEFPFQLEIEGPEMLTAFVRQLVAAIADQRGIQSAVARMTGKPPSTGSEVVLAAALEMLEQDEPSALIIAAEKVHDLAHEHNPEDAYPTDHLIDMLASCASAIRFGLEVPCRSRHAASAAQHVWRLRYGVTLEDNCTPAWSKDWARKQLQRAIVARMTHLAKEPTP